MQLIQDRLEIPLMAAFQDLIRCQSGLNMGRTNRRIDGHVAF